MKKELGKFFIDAAKLVLAGVVITSIMQDASNKWLTYMFGCLSIFLLLVIGLSIIEKEEKTK
ncbi:MAG: hypothetical protein IJ430_09570 [Parabacteroides sp.]|nr:hypothetical protein [Parabacteroides sp.]